MEIKRAREASGSETQPRRDAAGGDVLPPSAGDGDLEVDDADGPVHRVGGEGSVDGVEEPVPAPLHATD